VAAGSDCVTVTGPAGQEIDTDTYGRMTAKFFWDRVGPDDNTSSTPIRYAQLPIGGSMALARVGWEMVVRYLYGDPDRPVAVARVDNAVHTSPYAYPAAITANSLKTFSSPGAGAFNEFAMQDGGGGMKYGVTAAKDYFEQVNNDKTQKVTVSETLDVGVDHGTTIGGKQGVTIGAMQTKSVSANAGVTVTGNRTKTVSAAEMVTISGALTETVTGSDTESVGACRITAAATGVTRTAKGSCSLTVGGAMVEAAVMGCAVSTAGARSETVGGVKLSLSAGTITESVIGAMAQTVGGVLVNAPGGKSSGSSKGTSSLEVGGVVMLNAAGEVQIKAKTVKITVGGVANLLGGGGIINLTPGSAAFVGLVTLKGSNGVSMTGAPNLAG
jgi:type VI secretion system secreted protein VgrG